MKIILDADYLEKQITITLMTSSKNTTVLETSALPFWKFSKVIVTLQNFEFFFTLMLSKTSCAF